MKKAIFRILVMILTAICIAYVIVSFIIGTWNPLKWKKAPQEQPKQKQENNTGNQNDNNIINEPDTFKPHRVDGSEKIKSKTYYLSYHSYEQIDDTTFKMHICIVDVETEINNADFKLVNFKVCLVAADGSIEWNFEAYPDTTWSDWCESDFNHFTIENTINRFAVDIAESGCVIVVN